MSSLPPWASGPFELLVHAESHLRGAEDFDRSIALIGFDNAIEVAITTFLTLHPIQRGGRTFQSNEVDQWMRNYHTKLDFFENELEIRDITWSVEKSHIVWAHDQRNGERRSKSSHQRSDRCCRSNRPRRRELPKAKAVYCIP